MDLITKNVLSCKLIHSNHRTVHTIKQFVIEGRVTTFPLSCFFRLFAAVDQLWWVYCICLFWGEQSKGYTNMWYFWTPVTSPLQSWGCRHWLTDFVYYSLSLTERISKGCHRSPVSEDLINRTCHIPLHPLPFSELIKAIPICRNYTKHVTIKLCRWLIWVVERIN